MAYAAIGTIPLREQGGGTVSVDVRHVGSCVVVSVSGRFDGADAAWLAESVGRLCAEEPSASVVIDLTDVPVVERQAAGALTADLQHLAGRVALVAPRLSARRIIRRWGADRILLLPSVAAAVEQLPARAAPAGVPALASAAVAAGAAGFRHEAMPYWGREELVEQAASFVADGLTADEPVLVVLRADKLDALRDRLGPDAASVEFADMTEVGRNPARIIPLWRDFVHGHVAAGRHPRGVGEPVWPERSRAELVECQRHEALLNLAFADGPPWWLLCPYDAEALGPAVLEESHRSHPYLYQRGVHRTSRWYVGDDRIAAPFDDPLPEPPGTPPELTFDRRSLGEVATFVGRHGGDAGLWADEARDLARAVAEVAEVADNSVRHGGGQGVLRVWQEGDDVICEVRDAGHITSPLVGRERREDDREGRRGLWLANALCDLVQVRSSPAGTTVRLHLRRRASGTPLHE